MLKPISRNNRYYHKQEVIKLPKKIKGKKRPTLAPGNENILEAKASKKDIKANNYTQVTNLSYDEVKPS